MIWCSEYTSNQAHIKIYVLFEVTSACQRIG